MESNEPLAKVRKNPYPMLRCWPAFQGKALIAELYHAKTAIDRISMPGPPPHMPERPGRYPRLLKRPLHWRIVSSVTRRVMEISRSTDLWRTFHHICMGCSAKLATGREKDIRGSVGGSEKSPWGFAATAIPRINLPPFITGATSYESAARFRGDRLVHLRNAQTMRSMVINPTKIAPKPKSCPQR